MNEMIEDLVERVHLDVRQQYNSYKNEVDNLVLEYEKIKKESQEISKVIKQMQNDNILDNHLSKLFLLAKDGQRRSKRRDKNQQNMEKITLYFQKIQELSIKSLKLIFNIRYFFTGQEFNIFIENKEKIFSFSIEDIEKHVDGIIPTYTDSLEKFINNMTKNSKAIAPELNKLGLSLKNVENDLDETSKLSSYLEFVNYHFSKNKRFLSENRKLEAAIYLYGVRRQANFSDKKDRHSLHILLGQYKARGGVSDNITMYKLGDAIQKTEEGFRNIEVKMHNGTISLTMIANGIKRLSKAFNSQDPKEKISKFFNVNEKQLSTPIERAALKEVQDKIEEIFKSLT